MFAFHVERLPYAGGGREHPCLLRTAIECILLDRAKSVCEQPSRAQVSEIAGRAS